MVLFFRSTIAGRLCLIGGLALAALLALASVSIYFAIGTQKAAKILYSGSLVSSVEAGEIELLLERHRRLIEAAPLEFNRAAIQNDRVTSENIIAKIESLLRRTEGSFASNVVPGLAQLADKGRDVLRLAENFAQDRALPLVANYGVQAEALQTVLRRYRTVTVDAAEREARSLVLSASHLVLAVSVIALVVLVLIWPTAIQMTRKLLRRLHHITTAMSQLAQNNTNISLETETKADDEIGAMAKAVEVFRENAIALFRSKVRLEQGNEWLDVALNNVAHGVAMFDGGQCLVVCNEQYRQLYNLPKELTKSGVPFARLIKHQKQSGSETDAIENLASDMKKLRGSQGAELKEAQLCHKTHDNRFVEITMKPLTRGGWVEVHEDATERRDASERMTRLAHHDPLTGLANRYQYREVLGTLIENSAARFAILAIDLDHFKIVNDTFGHPVGDELLVAVATRLLKAVRVSDLVARLGGDEFAVILREPATGEDAEIIAGRIVRALQRPFQLSGQTVSIGGTVGIALSIKGDNDVDTLMRHADVALYSAKQAQRGTLAFYDSKIENRLRTRRSLEADLGRAIERDQLVLHYQPVVSLSQAKVIGCEALIRWQHPERGLVGPGEFIPIAEEIGLIVDIGGWALQNACAAAARWPNDLQVAVNLSVAQFSGPDLADATNRALRENNLPAHRLELEVTESLLLSHAPSTLDHLRRMQKMGVSIALDDFGTGYSSLLHLRSFPFDKLKIDRTFVCDLHKRSDCEAIVAATIGLASSLNMAVVAEGVEAEQDLAFLRDAGCDLIQSYLFSKPVPEDQLPFVLDGLESKLASLKPTQRRQSCGVGSSAVALPSLDAVHNGR